MHLHTGIRVNPGGAELLAQAGARRRIKFCAVDTGSLYRPTNSLVETLC
jgi:hypothetical protein